MLAQTDFSVLGLYSVYARVKDSAMPWLLIGSGTAIEVLDLVHKYQRLNNRYSTEIITMFKNNHNN